MTTSGVHYGKKGAFTDELKSKVDRLLRKHPELLWRARVQLALKAVVALALMAGSYLFLILIRPSHPALIGLGLLGLSLGAILMGFCVQHDANHRATFSRSRWNRLLGWVSADVCLGLGSNLWNTKHNVAHHSYTNVAGHDPDADQAPFLRLAPSSPGRQRYRWQVVYAWPLYLFMVFRLQFLAEPISYSVGRIGQSPLRFPRGWTRVGVITGKPLFLGWTFLVPILMGYPWWGVLSCYGIVSATLSLVMTVTFQLAHCVGEATYTTPGELNGKEWMVSQVETTVDFSPGNRWLSWWLGGLNYQIEHHLFPRLPHPLYPRLAPIVEEVCRGHGVAYHVHLTLWSAFRSHLRHLWEMGKLGQPLELEMG